MKKLDVIGHKYHRLTVEHLEYTGKKTFAHCKCDCGRYKKVWLAKLRNGNTKSCGCFSTEEKRKRKLQVKDGLSLADLYPDLTLEWSNKNSKEPTSYNPSSNIVVLWKCKTCTYEWSAPIHRRTCNKSGCPACSGRVTTDKNKLILIRPDIAKEWNYTKNIISIEDIAISSNKKVWWICKCGHEWKTTPNNRLKTGCPKCASSRGEKLIEEWLLDKKVIFKHQFRINDCRNKRPLPFDFAVWIKNNLYLIEFHGGQHFNLAKTGYFSDKEKFEYRKNNDSIKYNFCQERKIPLLIIPYYQQDYIPVLLKTFLEGKYYGN